MNELEKAIHEAFQAKGNSKEANKAYLEFIKSNFIIPVEKHSPANDPHVLYLTEEDKIFLPVFTAMDYLNAWAVEIKDQIQLLKLTGVNLLKGIGENITVSLNIGSPLYKEFNPQELARMRSIVLKIFNKN
ncbi:SseB family protein [Legionella londiniensis]|uniref:Putative Fe-S center protein n=1 Tax=Legionella londiniensis TaxID=45068 RepID=A0A0W0VSS4_9GAMM|nr:SseB family protein [Legionella londiniensis]KTD23021.1 putative Fe-S center protein [Legionella londiniensis]STX94038.1 putative Fe-S center protein [Legionella londiniensis]